MTPAEFAQKWKGSTAKERSASQEHFIDLCQMLGYPTPNSDPTGDYYAFEKGAEKSTGDDGLPMSGRRATSPGSTRASATTYSLRYQQLLQYHDALENPPLLIVCDLNRFEADPDMLNEYDFRGATRGKYAERYAQGTNVVWLAPDVNEAFPTERAVNAALRSLMRFQEDLRNPARELPVE